MEGSVGTAAEELGALRKVAVDDAALGGRACCSNLREGVHELLLLCDRRVRPSMSAWSFERFCEPFQI